MKLDMVPIGSVCSPYRECFGVPRQPGLVRTRAFIDLDPAQISAEALRGLASATHIWVIFVFDRVEPSEAKMTVRPPRLGGNERLGVLATRSPFRPNRLGMSAVRLVGLHGLRLDIEGADLLDGTPVLDIKPYLPWADAIESARLDWAGAPPARLEVRFTDAAQAVVRGRPELRALIEETSSLDPRPAFHADDPDRVYAMALADVDVHFTVDAGIVTVREVRAAATKERGRPPSG